LPEVGLTSGCFSHLHGTLVAACGGVASIRGCKQPQGGSDPAMWLPVLLSSINFS